MTRKAQKVITTEEINNILKEVNENKKVIAFADMWIDNTLPEIAKAIRECVAGYKVPDIWVDAAAAGIERTEENEKYFNTRIQEVVYDITMRTFFIRQ